MGGDPISESGGHVGDFGFFQEISSYDGDYRTYNGISFINKGKNGVTVSVTAGYQWDRGRALMQGAIHKFLGSGEFEPIYGNDFIYGQVQVSVPIVNTGGSKRKKNAYGSTNTEWFGYPKGHR